MCSDGGAGMLRAAKEEEAGQEEEDKELDRQMVRQRREGAIC